jgi:cytochrome c biogenesis factor
MLTNLSLTEASLMWTRFTAILYASGGLLAILSFAVEKNNKFMQLIVVFFWLLLAIVWFQTIRLSSFYYLRWQMDVDYLIKNDKRLKVIVRGRVNPRLKQSVKWSASKYSLLLPICFAVLWILVILNLTGCFIFV